MNKITKEFIQDKFQNDDAWLIRGIVAIFDGQRADEQQKETVKYHNGVGFRPTDAKFLCSVAKSILNGWGLSPKQVFVARKKMMKYAGQCAWRANEKIMPHLDMTKVPQAIEWTAKKRQTAVNNQSPVSARAAAAKGNYKTNQWGKLPVPEFMEKTVDVGPAGSYISTGCMGYPITFDANGHMSDFS